jgi:hypothetical protein
MQLEQIERSYSKHMKQTNLKKNYTLKALEICALKPIYNFYENTVTNI